MDKDFLELDNLPIFFTFPRFMRYVTLVIGFMLLVFSFYVVFTQINGDSSTFKKILPFIIMFLAADSLFRNLFSLNKVSIYKDKVVFSYIAKKKLIVNWRKINKLETYQGKGKFFVLYYYDNVNSKEIKKYYIPMAYNNILEIVNYIVYLSNDIQTDDFVKSLIYLKPNIEGKNV